MPVKHHFQSGRVDNSDAGDVQPSHWNANHDLTGFLALLDAVAVSPNTIFALDGSSQPYLIPTSQVVTLTTVNGLINSAILALPTVARSGNYNDLTSRPTLGTAAALNVGVGANQVVELDGSAKLPAVDGSQLTNVSFADGSVLARKLAASAIPMRAGIVNGTIVESHASSAVTFAIKTLAGTDPSATDPVYAVFQNGSGGYVVRSITAALSLTISNGSLMGVPGNSIPFRLWHLLIDTGTAAVLGAVNCLNGTSILPLHEGLTYSSTAEGGAGAADNAQTIYSTAAQSSKYICIVGYSDYDSGLATAGAWTASPTRTILWSPEMPRPGELIRTERAPATGASSGTTVIPFDDTIPQSTEGDQYLSISITPLSAQNAYRVRAQVDLAVSTGAHAVAALFRDSGANAIAAEFAYHAVAGASLMHELEFAGTFGGASATTFKLRAGPIASATVTFNGNTGSSRLMGGVAASFIEVQELMG